VFSDTKAEVGEVASDLSATIQARPLHGDIPQSQREITLKGFKQGNFSILVATDVAARGLDISCASLSSASWKPLLATAAALSRRSWRGGEIECYVAMWVCMLL
jgi:ATP-dependent RNA helicase DDX21